MTAKFNFYNIKFLIEIIYQLEVHLNREVNIYLESNKYFGILQIIKKVIFIC